MIMNQKYQQALIDYLRSKIAESYQQGSKFPVVNVLKNSGIYEEVSAETVTKWISKEIKSKNDKLMPILYLEGGVKQPALVELIVDKLISMDINIHSSQETLEGEFVLWVNQPDENTQAQLNQLRKEGIEITKVIGVLTEDKVDLDVPLSVICSYKKLNELLAEKIDKETAHLSNTGKKAEKVEQSQAVEV